MTTNKMQSNGRPTVSIIVNCYNEARFVSETLDSIAAQTCQDWEVVFWDNASDDESSTIAASYGNKVRCFRSDTMVPLGMARALAYEQTRGDFVAILDADDIWLPEKLERQLDLFHADHKVGMTYCDAIFFDQSGDRQRLFQLNTPHRGHVFGRLVRKNFMFSSSMMFRRAALDELGCAFDTKFARAQDYDLSLRVAYNYNVDYVDEPLLKWRMAGISDKPWKKSLIDRVVEVKMSMDGMIETYPEIKDRYADELTAFYKNLDYNYAVTAWTNGKNAEARNHLSKHLTDRKFATVYLATWLVPRNFFYKIRVAVRDLSKGRL